MSETLEVPKNVIRREELEIIRALSADQLMAKSPEELLDLSARLSVAAEAATLPAEADDCRSLETRVSTAFRLKLEGSGEVYGGEEAAEEETK